MAGMEYGSLIILVALTAVWALGGMLVCVLVRALLMPRLQGPLAAGQRWLSGRPRRSGLP
jgi:hypothetical protein